MRYQPSGLQPITASTNPRYERNILAPVSSIRTVVAAGLYSFTAQSDHLYLPTSWSVHTHPEGNVYFVKNTYPRILTDTNAYSSVFQQHLTRWADVIDGVCGRMNINLADSVELYLKPSQDGETCGYYFIDHATRIEFWLQSVDSDHLGIEGATSDTHLKHALEEHYWMHVEYFPCHDPRGLNIQLPALIDTMLHGRADQLTSSTSTFLYSAQECTRIMDLLKTAQDCGRIHTASMRCVIARLWSMICRHRFSIHSGQQHCRLSRDRSIFAPLRPKENTAITFVNRILFSVPDTCNQLLEDLWVDQLVYVDHWRPFIAACWTEWSMMLGMTFALMMYNVLLLIGGLGSRSISYIALIICNLNVICTIRLLTRHQRSAAFDTGNKIASYLSSWCSDTSRFRITAIEFSLPRALLLWALFVSSCHCIIWLSSALKPGYTGFVDTIAHLKLLGCCG